MKNIFIAAVCSIALIGCGNSKDEEAEKTKDSQITPPTAQQQAQNQAPNNQEAAVLTQKYAEIKSKMIGLNQAKDPNINEIINQVELSSQDGLIDMNEANNILAMISTHQTDLTKQSPQQNEQKQQTADQGDITKNPNPFE